ncbi:hypothetical protein CPC08DRAFT_176170 [Agrocybe pediades]|nr:hypothetical protein CPC08DRAFT_176170 [Agrocybe pediades]
MRANTALETSRGRSGRGEEVGTGKTGATIAVQRRISWMLRLSSPVGHRAQIVYYPRVCGTFFAFYLSLASIIFSGIFIDSDVHLSIDTNDFAPHFPNLT